MENLLEIKNLHVSVEGKEILKGIDLEVKKAKFMPLWDLMVPVKARWRWFWRVTPI